MDARGITPTTLLSTTVAAPVPPPQAREAGATRGGGPGFPDNLLAKLTTPAASIIGGLVGGGIGLLVGSIPGAAIGAVAGAALGAAALRTGPKGPDGEQPFGDWWATLSSRERDDATRFFEALEAREQAQSAA